MVASIDIRVRNYIGSDNDEISVRFDHMKSKSITLQQKGNGSIVVSTDRKQLRDLVHALTMIDKVLSE